MSRSLGWQVSGALLFAALLSVAWWGWQQGGLELLQLGMGIC